MAYPYEIQTADWPEDIVSLNLASTLGSRGVSNVCDCQP